MSINVRRHPKDAQNKYFGAPANKYRRINQAGRLEDYQDNYTRAKTGAKGLVANLRGNQ